MSPTLSISLTTLCEVIFAASFIGAVIFLTKSSSTSPTSGSSKSGSYEEGSSKKSGKGKKKKSTTTTAAPPTAPVVKEEPKKKPQKKVEEVVPEPVVPTAPAEEKRAAIVARTKKTKPSPSPPVPTPVIPTPPSSSTPSFASIASATSPHKPLAESRMKPLVKTSTSDMRDEEIDPLPSVARVMRVVSEKESRGGWGDEWEKGGEEEDEWEVKKPKKSIKASISTTTSSAYSIINPSPSSTPPFKTIPGLPTKKQRENQKKAQKAAEAKDALERERLDRLAKHRRELERVRMSEQEKERNKGKGNPVGPRSVNVGALRERETRAKEQSGGMRASLDDDGKLIWE